TYLSGLSMKDLLAKVAALPENTIIYYVHVVEDGAGRAFLPANALALLAAQANAPIYSHVGSFVGNGAVGGHTLRFERAGEEAARIGLRVLSGEKPSAIRIQPPNDNVPTFDWRQLRRWGLSEAALPPGSIVLDRQPTFWERYRL